MSDTIWLEVTDGTTKEGGERDNSIMLRLSSELDALAARMGVRPPSEFHNPRGLAWLPFRRARDSWFDPADGVRTFSALVDELRQHPEALGFSPAPSQAHWPAMLLDELEYCLAGLTEAATQNRRFRLLLVS